MPIALRSLKLLGTQYGPAEVAGQTIPAEVWDKVPENNRRSLVNGKMVGPDMIPAPTPSTKRRKASGVPSQS